MTEASSNAQSAIALVTGGGTGIGRAIAKALGSAGFKIVISGRRADVLEKSARELSKETGAEFLAVAADVSDPNSVRSLFDTIAGRYGRLDLLVNNAGMGLPAVPMEELSFEQWNAIVGANLTGAFLCTQQAFRLMKAQTPQGGRIINNGSISATTPRPHSAPYTATKHAITGLTKSTALDGRPFDIACGQIDIGNAATDMTARMSAGVLQANGETAAEPTISAEHVARAVVYMATLPLDANVLSMTVMATKMPLVGRG
ncbi:MULTISPECIES: SDR family oxidoreductase [unclassified Rhizobium]|uniref:SDR family oxidoreductase n=1 Tax=unclassified Rhizobium TaxID=2613769 RepID=UPI000DE17129|nr:MULTISPECIES: SDR family oxidoreductase [unclassified Rhizobium]MBB3285490.1 NAD(P)-dependent dehydrogenase (short-subunit alcohol dehydrogenase family) [Rhizobium sp. BK252]MBB3400230.1 NAD(P)-dependent dehydrogenase (short-subunit alcohol dehydrogenase family) [Rhizobium sp. BK289]MBB3412809.1 NAD(P)-dependent dehydrogenase (short-subunit alcohol dehydrogenase family) [Rhizobium sp. BK284]MBB3480696.1 NAD(P)-dependent dehydrogenase (short-subunit alcohol dehydrogenase family) [Rhizobium sp